MNYEIKRIQGDLFDNVIELRCAYEDIVTSYIDEGKSLVNTIHEWKSVAKSLWQLLDDIDISSDIWKPTLENPKSLLGFYKQALEYAERRFEYLKSDGYDLYTPTEFAKLFKSKVKSEPCSKSIYEGSQGICLTESSLDYPQTYNAG